MEVAEMAVEPDQQQLEEIQALAGGPDDGPLVMLNLNRYSDRDAYSRYGEVAQKVLEKVGGKILWHAPALSVVVGTDAERYDDVIAVWYPSAAAFIALAMDPEILAVREDRIAGLEQATLLRCESGEAPELTGIQVAT
jgi:uncharacterized protein (DUF1330 family)